MLMRYDSHPPSTLKLDAALTDKHDANEADRPVHKSFVANGEKEDLANPPLSVGKNPASCGQQLCEQHQQHD